ncbi:unnamed protein product [Diamesa tonsa]
MRQDGLARQTAARRAKIQDEHRVLSVGEVPAIFVMKPIKIEPIAIEPIVFEPIAIEPIVFEPIVFEPIAMEPIVENQTNNDESLAEITLDSNYLPEMSYSTEENNNDPEYNSQYPFTSTPNPPNYDQQENNSNDIYNMALRLSREIGYSYEVLPIFCALVKLANKDEPVILEALAEGKLN